MKRLKKWFSLLLVIALIVSLAKQSEITASAAETAGEETMDEDPVDLEENSASESIKAIPEFDEESEELPSFGGESEELPSLNGDAGTLPSGEEPGPILPAETEVTDQNILETVLSEETKEQPGAADEPMVMSMFPYEEHRVSVYLNDYTQEQLIAMPVDDLLDMLLDDQGNKIQIPPDAEILCGYQKDAEGYPLDEDSFRKVERGGTIDLSDSWQEDYRMQLIIGDANQLALGNIRYIVTVYVGLIKDEIEYELYVDNGSGRSRISCNTIWFPESSLLEDTGIPVSEVSYYVEDTSAFKAGDECYLNIQSLLKEDTNRDIDVKVYPMADFLDYYQNQNPLQGEITDILNQPDMYSTGGHKGIYARPDPADPLSSDNVFCIVYSDSAGRVIAYRGLVFTVCSGDFTPLPGGVYAYEAGQMKNAAELTYTRPNKWEVEDWKIDKDGNVIANYAELTNQYRLLDNYSADADYYYALDVNNEIEKIFRGYYESKEDAENQNAEDVTAMLLPDDRGTAPYGYKVKAGDHYTFSILFKNGDMCTYYIYLSGQARDDSISFEVTGAKGYERKVYRWAGQEDSYYKNHYQMLLINDTNADLGKLIPEFYCSGENVKVYVGEEQKSGESIQDFSNGPVTYSVFADGNPKQYFVTFVKKETEAKLFVNGPGEREIFLTDMSVYRNHDIVIANVGEKDLTGLKVELQNPSHVKLDDYWTVGGPGNSILSPFTTVEEKDENDHYVSEGHLFNLAKIRLLPDGEGEISGTLKISADGQKDVYIKLRGFAGNPRIITESLGEGVKYVPYSYHIATNNMYDWNKIKLSITRGKLPEGMTLNETTGEIYGVPREAGEFPITVRASYDRKEFENSYASFTLVIHDNTDDNVYGTSDPGYEILEHIGVQRANPEFGTYHYILTSKADQLFVSAGVIEEFVGFWLNGEKLVEGEDYTKESGSTRITIRRQTFENKADQSGTNTIAAEFRVNGDKNSDLKRTAQNFQIEFKSGGNSGGHHSDSSNDSSGGGSAGGSTSGNNLAILVVHLTDAAGKALPNLTVELHSVPQITKTDQNGIAVFQNVESGWHTIYVKNGLGTVLASKRFELMFGDSTSSNGEQIIVNAGSASTLELQLRGSELIFQNIQRGDPYQVLPAKTYDESDLRRWLLLACALCVMIVGCALYGGRRKRLI